MLKVISEDHASSLRGGGGGGGVGSWGRAATIYSYFWEKK